ncbi:MAG: ATP-dependent endonuclease, partial [Clostridia bacterium]|nr:ATP-dependent endonuclease [Clostridia bacterium]
MYSKCTQKQNEGFFADKVILVEGNTEGYALPIYFRKMGFDLDASNTVLIECGSVDNINPVCRIFTAFHIPT